MSNVDVYNVPQEKFDELRRQQQQQDALRRMKQEQLNIQVRTLECWLKKWSSSFQKAAKIQWRNRKEMNSID